MSKYRIKAELKPGNISPFFKAQMKVFPGIWVTVKTFHDQHDPDFAEREAEELLDKLNEK